MSGQALGHTLRLLDYRQSLQLPLTATERLVFILLSSRHNQEEGLAWPSIRSLAAEANLSDRKVQQAIRRLEEIGLIRCTARHTERNGKRIQTSNGYRIIGLDFARDLTPESIPTALGHASETRGVNHVHRGGEYSSPGGVNTVHQGGEPRSPKLNTEQIIQQNSEQRGANAPDTPPSKGQPEAHPEETTVKQRLLRTWRTATGKVLTAGQIAKGADLWQMYAVSGRADAFWQLLDEATGKGWRWAGFVSAAEERYKYGPAAYSGRVQTIGRPASMPANDYDPSFDAISRRLIEISPEGFYATQ